MKWVFLLTVLVCGCLNQTTVVEKFVCCDGWVVDSPDDCLGRNTECPKCPECETRPTTSLTVTPSDNACLLLGCPKGTVYVASKMSDIYHLCSCRYAKSISEKNLVCYLSESEALLDNKRPDRTCLG